MTQTYSLGQDTIARLAGLAQQLRVDSVRASSAAGSGHPTSSLSAADLMAVLLASYLRYDFANPDAPGNDHLIFSKGHASPLLYAMLKAAGAISADELLTYRKLGSRLEGHPTPRLPWVDVATGSLGQGLPIGVGLALAGKQLDRLPYHIWVLCGDSEMAEGSMWEAIEHAAFSGLDNLGMRSRSTATTSPTSTGHMPRPGPRPGSPRRSSPGPGKAAVSRPSRTWKARTASRSMTRIRQSGNLAGGATTLSR